MEEKHSREVYPSTEEKELHVVRNHKDTVFRLLYQNREKLLELYNALNGTAYEDSGAVEICTLENAIYMEVKNDVSFLFDSQMNLYEHQSSFTRTCRCGISFISPGSWRSIRWERACIPASYGKSPFPGLSCFITGRRISRKAGY